MARHDVDDPSGVTDRSLQHPVEPPVVDSDVHLLFNEELDAVLPPPDRLARLQHAPTEGRR